MKVKILIFVFCLLTFAFSVEANTRLGLHTTSDELSVWRTRAVSGPYKSVGDVSSNSPGDWDRINTNAETFRANPNAGLWNGPSGTGCISAIQNDPPFKAEAQRMRDAAFKALIQQDTDLKTKVRDWIIAQANRGTLDFANRTRWCINNSACEATFTIAEWLNIILFSMDYIEILDPNVFTSGQRTVIRDWFFNFGDMVNTSFINNRNGLFVDRLHDDYTPTQAAGYGWTSIPYMDAKGTAGPNYSIYVRWNNRQNAVAHTLASIAVKFGVATFRDQMVRYGKEVIRFSVFPQGFLTDFDRWSDSGGVEPDKGWAYGASVLGQALGVADVLARDGDKSVYDYTTSLGLYGSEGGNKNYLYAMTVMANYLDGTIDRYGTDQAGRAGNVNYKIDGFISATSKIRLNDFYWIVGNNYYKNAYIKSIYMRTAPNTRPYPSLANSQNGDLDYQGQSGMYPGALFMFGQMESLVDPYNLTPGLPNVTWTCSTCTPTAGTAVGTTSWTIGGVTLSPGTNVVTVTATDINGVPSSPVSRIITYQPTFPGNTMAGAWGFQETPTGITVTDSSVNKNNGTLTNGATWTSQGYGGSQGITFNGTNQYVRVDGSANSLQYTQSFSVSAWVLPTSLTGFRAVMAKGYSALHPQFGLYASSTGVCGSGVPTAFLSTNGDVGPIFYACYSTPLPTGQWSHLAATYDGTSLKLYVNGNLGIAGGPTSPVTTPATGFMIPNATEMSIGSTPLQGEYFAGIIDRARTYNFSIPLTDVGKVNTVAGAACGFANYTTSTIASTNYNAASVIGDMNCAVIPQSLTPPLTLKMSATSNAVGLKAAAGALNLSTSP